MEWRHRTVDLSSREATHKETDTPAERERQRERERAIVHEWMRDADTEVFGDSKL